MPKATPEQKAVRRQWIDAARSEAAAKKVMEKYYPDGVQPFDESVFDAIFAQEDQADEALKQAYAEKDKQKAKSLRMKKQRIREELRRANRQFSIYHRAILPYTEAEKLLRKQEELQNLDALRAMATQPAE